MKNFWQQLDKKVFLIGGIICFFFVTWAALAPQTAETVLGKSLTFFTTDFGWLYLLVVTVFTAFLIWIAVSPFGKIVLGDADAKPEYSRPVWFFMLFAAGMGIGLVFWSVAEPMSHYLNPPLGEGGTVVAAQEAMRYSFMHWGIHPWVCYGIVGLPLAYFQFKKKQPALISSCFIPLIGESRANGFWGSIINVLAVLATVFGVATSLGMGAMQINSGLNYAFGIPYSNFVSIVIIIIATAAFITSAVSGIDKGIRVLSNVNMVLVGILMLFVFLVGPTLFIVNFAVSSLGQYLQQLVAASFWTDPFDQSQGWLGSWTVFYWAWWISWTPFVGGFIARISKGRTIREFIIGILVFPVLFSFIFITIMGGTAIHFDMQGLSSVATAMGENIAFALFALLKQLPLFTIFSLLAIILIGVFFVTSADSATFVCAMMTSKGVQNPYVGLKVFWGVIQGAIAAVLLLTGGLSALQTVSIVVAFPFMIVCVLMAISFLKVLRDDEKTA